MLRISLIAACIAVATTAAASPVPPRAPRPRPNPCALDVMPPALSLALVANAADVDASVDVADACGVALVLFSIDGDLAGGRLHAPWSLTLHAEPGAEICALAQDRAGNSALACEMVPAAPAACSGDLDCSADEYCRFPDGACAGPGSCEIRPEVCTADYLPVCGCDGATYGNACAAASFGVSLLHDGECP